MGEIKSTLDLVMERTRHLSLSEDEKRRQRESDFEKRLQGLLQQYADSALSTEALMDRMGALQAELNFGDRAAIAKIVIGRVDPRQDNKHWLALLAHLSPATCAPLEDTLAAYNRQQAVLMETAGEQQRTRLAREHGIHGSAILPNPQKEASYQERLAALRSETQAGIAALAKHPL